MIAFVNAERIDEYRKLYPDIYVVKHATMPKDRKWLLLNDGSHLDIAFDERREYVEVSAT